MHRQSTIRELKIAEANLGNLSHGSRGTYSELTFLRSAKRQREDWSGRLGQRLANRSNGPRAVPMQGGEADGQEIVLDPHRHLGCH